MVRKPKLVAFTPEIGRRVKKNAGGTLTSIVDFDTKPRRGAGTGIRWYKLLEDTTSPTAQIYAVQVDSFSGANPRDTPVKVIPWLIGATDVKAQAGYIAKFNRDGDSWSFLQGDCPTRCEHEGTLSIGSPPTGTVGTPYTHAITGTNLVGGNYSTVDMTGLPPGLTHDEEDISGTPTEAGTFYVVVSADSPGTGDSEGDTCTITRVMVITIDPEAEE